MTRAAKLLPVVRAAVPRHVWPVLAVACVVKCLPFDGGVDEALFALAFGLIARARPGLLRALWQEAQAGRPAACGCSRCVARAARRRARLRRAAPAPVAGAGSTVAVVSAALGPAVEAARVGVAAGDVVAARVEVAGVVVYDSAAGGAR